MNIQLILDIEYAKLCQTLGDIEAKIELLKADSQIIKDRISSLSQSKNIINSAVNNLASEHPDPLPNSNLKNPEPPEAA